jgi:hypothetical protein
MWRERLLDAEVASLVSRQSHGRYADDLFEGGPDGSAF